jgi:hypothetical protein
LISLQHDTNSVCLVMVSCGYTVTLPAGLRFLASAVYRKKSERWTWAGISGRTEEYTPLKTKVYSAFQLNDYLQQNLKE